MKVFNKLSPNDEQLNGFVEGDVETPIAMVNLLKFKKRQSMRMAERLIYLVLKHMLFMEKKFKNVLRRLVLK